MWKNKYVSDISYTVHVATVNEDCGFEHNILEQEESQV